MNLKKVITSNSFLLFSLLFLSFLCIFIRFLNIPKNLALDEVAFTKLALSLKSSPYTVYSTAATGHSTLYFYILLLSFQLFGVTNFALRLPAAVFGILSVVIFFLILGHSRFTKVVAFFLALILLTSHWYLNFARFSFEATFLLFLELSALYFIIRFSEKKSDYFLVLSAVFTGLSFHSYYPGRLFVVVPLLLLLLLKIKIKLFALFISTFLLVAAPLLIYLSAHKDIRITQQSFMNNRALSFQKKISYFADNVSRVALMFHFKGDSNGRHNYPEKPAVNPALGILFVIGLAISLKQIKKAPNVLFISYFLVSLVPSLFTYPQENPHMLRTISALPPLVYFIGVTVNYIVTHIPKTYVKKIWFLLFFLFLVSSLYELRTYFYYQKKVFDKAFEVPYDK